MIAVIQCAASKRRDAGHLLSADKRPVVFVADPSSAPADASHVFARPDDPCGDGITWREALLKYNRKPGNPSALLPAWELYENAVYQRLVNRLGLLNVFILSAGWGLITADFLTPYYDITFSQSAENYKRRRHADVYADFRMLPDKTNEELVFFGSRHYVPLFCELTEGFTGTRTVFFNTRSVPQARGCILRRFDTTTRTNWHYLCAKAFVAGKL
jgi:hypothetical protein